MSGSKNLLDQMRSEALQCFNASLNPVNPYEAVKRFVHIDGKRLIAGSKERPVTELNLDDYKRIFIVGGGKATALEPAL